jgi:hypothetical protein
MKKHTVESFNALTDRGKMAFINKHLNSKSWIAGVKTCGYLCGFSFHDNHFIIGFMDKTEGWKSVDCKNKILVKYPAYQFGDIKEVLDAINDELYISKIIGLKTKQFSNDYMERVYKKYFNRNIAPLIIDKMNNPQVNLAQDELDKIETQDEMFRYIKSQHAERKYTASQILSAAKEGEVNHFDAEHIVKILERTNNNK